MDEIRLGDIGTAFEVTIKENKIAVDISTATSKVIIFKKPDGSRVEKTAEFVTNGSDGKIQYITQAGDIDQASVWKIQGRVAMPGWNGSSSIDKFTVGDNL